MIDRSKIKATLIERDVEWLRSTGDLSTTVRQVDEHVTAGLDRAAAKARESRRVAAPKAAPAPVGHDENKAHAIAQASGYDLQIGDRNRRRKVAVPYACNKCGTCVRCRRELRAMNILRMAKQGDTRLRPMANRIIAASFRAQSGSAEFTGLSGRDCARILTRIIEDICDQSVPIAGAWR